MDAAGRISDKLGFRSRMELAASALGQTLTRR
jgi:hypothetical protein